MCTIEILTVIIFHYRSCSTSATNTLACSALERARPSLCWRLLFT